MTQNNEVLTYGQQVEVSELIALQQNDFDLYNSRELPIIKNLTRKAGKGIFDEVKAAKLAKYLFDDVARKYKASSDYQFTPTVRREAARRWVADFLVTYLAENLTTLNVVSRYARFGGQPTWVAATDSQGNTVTTLTIIK